MGTGRAFFLHSKYNLPRELIHPDGRHIAFAAATEVDSAAGIWVMENFLPGSRAGE